MVLFLRISGKNCVIYNYRIVFIVFFFVIKYRILFDFRQVSEAPWFLWSALDILEKSLVSQGKACFGFKFKIKPRSPSYVFLPESILAAILITTTRHLTGYDLKRLSCLCCLIALFSSNVNRFLRYGFKELYLHFLDSLKTTTLNLPKSYKTLINDRFNNKTQCDRFRPLSNAS